MKAADRGAEPGKARPLETRYNGRRYRSRLEARWQIAFETLDVRTKYEPEGFELDGEAYLPDFYLPDRRLWVEIKPDLQEADLSKPVALARYTAEPVAILGDIPEESARGPHHLLVGYDRAHHFTATWFAWVPTDAEIGGVLEEPHGFVRFIGSENRMPDMWAAPCSEVYIPRRIADAYRVARCARFEHGERVPARSDRIA